MWKRPSVCRKSLLQPVVTVGHFLRPHRYILPIFLSLASFFLAVPATAEPLIAKIILNQEDKGDFFVDRTDAGDFLVKATDLKAIGFRDPSGKSALIEGESYISLRSMASTSFVFDEKTLSLVITAPPSLLGKKIIDFTPPRRQKVYYPLDSSFFLNYGLDYTAGNGFSFTGLNLANQLGVRKGNFLILSDSNFSKDQTREHFVRLQSSLIYDDRPELRRFIAGDFFASSGKLGSSLNLGGVSFDKVYRIDPYFINYPTITLDGQVGLPSEANIYLNGALVRTEKLSPGEFELRNMSYYGGAGNIDIVMKDVFGREQRLHYPFYFGDSFLLRQGLHEYSYNLGFIRERFGAESNDYSNLALLAFHRYGISDVLTLGFRAEAKNDLYNMGPGATFLLGNAGIFDLSLAGSTGRSSNGGGAALFSYLYQGLHAGARAALIGFTRNYATIATEKTLDKLKYEASAGVNYTDSLFGSLSLNYTVTRKYVGQDRDTATVGYNRSLTREATLTATFTRTKEQDYANAFFISLNYTPKPNMYVTATFETVHDITSGQVDVQKNLPVGEGLGYRASVGRSSSGGRTISTVSPSLQYNARFGTYQGDFTGQDIEGRWNEQYHLSAAGALVYVGNTFGLTRPVYDSFGLVKAGDLEGIKVFLNTEEIGETDSSGKLFVPNLGSYYENQVAINDKQIPIDYYLSNVLKLVSPPLRSGSCINFVAKKLQPITGVLKLRINGEVKPVEFQEITLTADGRQVTFPTGTGGEFYIDVSQSEEFKKLAEAEESGCAAIATAAIPFIQPGTYRAVLMHEGKQHTFDLVIPPSSDPIIDLGQIVVDTPPEAGKEPPATETSGPEEGMEKVLPARENAAEASAPPGSVPHPAPKTASPEPGNEPPATEVSAAPQVLVPEPAGGTKSAEPASPGSAKPWVPAASEELPPTEVHFRFGSTDVALADDRMFFSLPRVC